MLSKLCCLCRDALNSQRDGGVAAGLPVAVDLDLPSAQSQRGEPPQIAAVACTMHDDQELLSP